MMNWLESIVYGLLSGISEFLPISSHAHQELLRLIFGVEQANPLVDFFVHLGMLLSVYSGCKTTIEHFRRDHRQHPGGTRRQSSRFSADVRFIKNATIPMLIGIAVVSYIFNSTSSLLLTALLLLINGIVIYIPSRVLQGDKDGRSMTLMDSLLVGFAGSVSAMSGISRVGAVVSVSTIRGADRKNALNWAFLLSLPALIIIMGIDLLQIFVSFGSLHFWSSLLSGVIAAMFSYVGGLISIALMKFMSVRTGFSGFSYYCWGAALLTFILYLMVA